MVQPIALIFIVFLTKVYGDGSYGGLSDEDDTIEGFIAGDNVVDVWVDGVHQGFHDDLGVAKGFIFPKSAKVIGFRGVDCGGLGGLIGSFSDGLVTDAFWRCSNTTDDRWQDHEFDDSTWDKTITYVHPEGRPYNVHETAQWIWTDRYHYEDKIVFCRRVRY